jgi:hypothetical protein
VCRREGCGVKTGKEEGMNGPAPVTLLGGTLDNLNEIRTIPGPGVGTARISTLYQPLVGY